MSTARELRHIKRLVRVINATLQYTTGSLTYDRVTEALTRLANVVSDYDGDGEDLWYIGEGSCEMLADMIPGAYWHFTEWHDGQWSPSYAALSALGTVFSPGCGSPERDNATFLALETMASENDK